MEHAAYLVKNPLVVRDLTKKQPIETADKVETAIETVEAVTVKDETATDTVEAVDTVESVDEPDQLAIGTVTPEVSPSPPETDAIASIDGTVESVEPISTIELDKGAIEDSEKKIMEPVGGSDSLDTLPVPPITDKTIDQNAIEVPSAKKGLTDSELARELGIDKSNITRWKQKGHPTPKYQNQWELRGRFWYNKDQEKD